MRMLVGSAVLLVTLVAALAGCPLGKGGKKKGEACYYMNDCESANCSTGCQPNQGKSCADAGVCQ